MIKTLGNRQRDRVPLDSIIAGTIEQLVALDPPPGLSPCRRVAPVETTAYRVEAYLVEAYLVEAYLVGWLLERVRSGASAAWRDAEPDRTPSSAAAAV